MNKILIKLCSILTGIFSFMVGASTPSVPSSLILPTGVSANQNYTIKWGSSSGDVTRYDLVGEQSGYLQRSLSKSSTRNNPEGHYCYKVRACNNNICSAYTPTRCLTISEPSTETPAIPSGFNVPPLALVNDNYVVRWKQGPAFITRYDLVGEKSGYLQKNLSTFSTRKQSKVGEYCYKVRACNDNNCSSYTPKQCISVEVQPSVPLSFHVPEKPVQNIPYSVTWGKSDGSVDRYELFGEQQGLISQTSELTALRDNPVGKYCYKVRACNRLDKCSSYTTTKCANVAPVGKPTSIEVPEISRVNTEFDIKWGAAKGPVDSYQLLGEKRGVIKSGDYNFLSFGRRIKSAGTYCYKVRACDQNGQCGDYTSTACTNVVAKKIFEVQTLPELQRALDSAVSGDGIALTDNIDLGADDIPLFLNSGVTLSGNKYKLKLKEVPIERTSILKVTPGVVIHNVKLVGPYMAGWNPHKHEPKVTGIEPAELSCPGDESAWGNYKKGLVTVTASEVSGLTNGIIVGCREKFILKDNKITDNYMAPAYNGRDKMGYGVTPVRATSEVELYNNTFLRNRHDIALNSGRFNGQPKHLNGQNVIAKGNTFGEEAKGHSFDIHGNCNVVGNGELCEAGSHIIIENNTFKSHKNPAILIRGRPTTLSGGNGSIDILGNTYAKGVLPIRQISDSYEERQNPDTKITDYLGNCSDSGSRLIGGKKLQVSFSGTSDFTSVSQMLPVKPIAYGHFNRGEAPTNFSGEDILFIDGSKLRVWSYVVDKGESWRDWMQCASLKKDDIATSDVFTGDFNGDGLSDIFEHYKTQGIWKIAYGIYDPEKTLIQHRYAAHTREITASGYDLKFGFFTKTDEGIGDKITDVFGANGTTWAISSAGSADWQVINKQKYNINQLLFADITGDSRTDVFVFDENKTDLLVFDAGRGAPLRFAGVMNAKESETATLSQFALGNFTGSARTDLFYTNESNGWQVYDFDTKKWTTINSTQKGKSTDEFSFADINGDGITDILYYGD